MAKRVLIWTGLAVAAGIGAVGTYFGMLKPVRAAAPAVKVEMTKARLERGRYLFTLADCDGCHSERDFSRFGGPVMEGRRAAGNIFPSSMKMPGRVVAPNITPDPETGIGNWTDGEKIRAIREGIDRHGRPLFPMMPYSFFRNMSDEDVKSLVAYLNSLPPVRRELPRTSLDFPVSVLIRTEPRPAGRVPEPDRTNPVKYGKYLVTLGLCMECHTPKPDMLLAGGKEFRFPGLRVVTANITPDEQTGIGLWKQQDFVDRFYQYREYVENGSPAVGPEGFTLMPWLNLSQLPAEDLRAIYSFLRTVRPVYNAVETHPGMLLSQARPH